MPSKKTWKEKLNTEKTHQVKVIEKRFADIPAGSKMLVPTPAIVNEYVKSIPLDVSTDLSTMRNDLAIEYQADKSCPVTSSIFLRIVSEAAYEDFQAGKSIEDIVPFWRVVNPQSKLAVKLACGLDFIEKQRKKEGI